MQLWISLRLFVVASNDTQVYGSCLIVAAANAHRLAYYHQPWLTDSGKALIETSATQIMSESALLCQTKESRMKTNFFEDTLEECCRSEDKV